jgi:tetratricopeptide (TPR) repeat protein
VQSSSLEIKILGDTPFKKGKAFEEFMRLILSKLGYSNFMSPVFTTGMEFDIRTIHKETEEPLLCECKAHEGKIDTGDLLKFYGKLCHERSNDKSLKGMFFSTSGFTGTAQKNYDELSESDKQIFKIYGNEGIVQLLRKSGMMAQEDEMERKIMSKIKYTLGDRYVVFSESDLYIVQIIQIGGQARNFYIFTPKGDMAESAIRKKIKDTDERLKSLEEFKPEIIDSVILNLLELQPKTAGQLSGETNETINDIEIALDEAELENLVLRENGNDGHIFTLSRDIKAFMKIAERYLMEKAKAVRFMSSNYLQWMINDEFINLISYRFKLHFDEKLKQRIITISKIFPSALYLGLFRYTIDFENSYEQIENSNMSFDEKGKRHKDTALNFMGQMLARIREDLHTLPAKYLESKGIRAFNDENSIRIASDNELIIDEADKSSGYLAVAKGTIQPGQLVMADNDAIMNMGNACMLVRDYQNAKVLYEKIINLTDDVSLLKAAWNNTGVCYMRMQVWVEAVRCFKKVLSYDQSHPEASMNLTHCVRTTQEILKHAKLTKKAIDQLVNANN